jgi:hypothetical protein
MLVQAFGSPERAPTNLVALLHEVRGVIAEIEQMREEALTEQRKYEAIEERGRAARESLGNAVHQLGFDLSQAKEAQRRVAAEQTEMARRCESSREEYKASLQEIVVWEGRCAMLEPAKELTEAYYRAAHWVEGWRIAKSGLAAAHGRTAACERIVLDLEFQIGELRSALSQHEQNIDRELASCEQRVALTGKRIVALEERLFALTSQFTGPLRGHSLLEPLFKELERVRAA